MFKWLGVLVLASVAASCASSDEQSLDAGEAVIFEGSESVTPSSSTTSLTTATVSTATESTTTTSAAETTTTTAVPETATSAVSANPVRDVAQSFEAYRSAVLDGDGEAATGLVTKETLEWYQLILDYGTSPEVDGDALLNDLPLGDAITVFALRAQFGQDLASVPDGRQLFVEGVERGLVGDNVATMQFDRINVVDDTSAFGVIQGVPATQFLLEDGVWRFDIPYTLIIAFGVADEEDLIAELTGSTASTRLELFELLAPVYGSTWEVLSQAPASN